MNVHIENNYFANIENREVEIVERKGLGHPDTLADGLAEAISRNYSVFCNENFGAVLHHNTDKTGIFGGSTMVKFGGGAILSPITVGVNGRFSHSFANIEIPVHDIIEKSVKDYLSTILINFNLEKDLNIFSRLSSEASPGLVKTNDNNRKGRRQYWFRPRNIHDLFELNKPFSNDTSCGVGYSPLSTLESFVLKIDNILYSGRHNNQFPEIGTDIKIMAFRKNKNIQITLAVPLLSTYTHSLDSYKNKLSIIHELILSDSPVGYEVNCFINNRDIYEIPELYLTYTGSSIENGDEGLVGRGNRCNGLITPMRFMSIEGASGKNPIYHVGKLYNILAQELSHRLHQLYAECFAVAIISQAGRDLYDPWLLYVLQGSGTAISDSIVRREFESLCSNMNEIQMNILSGKVQLF